MARKSLKISGEKDLLGRRLLFVTAHPDDEAFLCCGTMHKNREAGGQSALLCATYGEKGKGHLGYYCTCAKLKTIRRRELLKAARFLKLDKLFAFGLPDRRLMEFRRELKNKIARILSRWRPEVVLSFGPDGISGHIDHIVIGKVAKSLALSQKISFAAFAPAPEFIRNFEATKMRRAHGIYAPAVRHSNHNFKLKADPKVKEAVLLTHKSQDLFKHFPKNAIREILNYDFYRF